MAGSLFSLPSFATSERTSNDDSFVASKQSSSNLDAYFEAVSGGRPATSSTMGRALFAPFSVHSVAPVVGAGFDLQSPVHERTKLEKPRSHGYASVGAAVFASHWRLVAEHRWRGYLQKVDEALPQPQVREWRLTIAGGTLRHQHDSFASAGQWFVEPYGELVARRLGSSEGRDANDVFVSGFVRVGHRFVTATTASFALDALAEPFVSRSWNMLAGDNRSEMRVALRSSIAGYGWGGGLSLGAARGCFAGGVRAAEAGEARCHSAPRFLLTAGRFF